MQVSSVLFCVFFYCICQVNCAYIFGYILHNPIPEDKLLISGSGSENNYNANPEPDQLLNDSPADIAINKSAVNLMPRCHSDADCHGNQLDSILNRNRIKRQLYCDSHYSRCDFVKTNGHLCRRDGQCAKGLICMFGKCSAPAPAGTDGARCAATSDCDAGHCCARQHGEKVCKLNLKRGQKCFVPFGGLDYSLNELCPCDDGLVCEHRRNGRKRKRPDLLPSPNAMRCAPAK